MKKIICLLIVIIIIPLRSQWSEQVRITNTEIRSEMQGSEGGVAHFALTPYEVGETNRGVY